MSCVEDKVPQVKQALTYNNVQVELKDRQLGLGNNEKFLMLHKEYQKLDKKLEDVARTVEQNQLEDRFYPLSIGFIRIRYAKPM